MHLIILVSQVTVTIRGLGLCCCVSCYVCDVCRLLLMLLSLSQWGFIVGGRIKGGRGPERQFAKEVQPPGSRQPESSWENNNSNKNMLVTYYATKYTRRCLE